MDCITNAPDVIATKNIIKRANRRFENQNKKQQTKEKTNNVRFGNNTACIVIFANINILSFLLETEPTIHERNPEHNA